MNNIKAARDLLIADGLSTDLTNSLLGKVIFVRYLIDREVKLDFEKEGKSRKWTNTEFCGLLTDKQNVKAFFMLKCKTLSHMVTTLKELM